MIPSSILYIDIPVSILSTILPVLFFFIILTMQRYI